MFTYYYYLLLIAHNIICRLLLIARYFVCYLLLIAYYFIMLYGREIFIQFQMVLYINKITIFDKFYIISKAISLGTKFP